MDKFKCPFLQNGKWDKYVARCQQKIVPLEGMVFTNNVIQVIWTQKKMRRTTNDWKLQGTRQYLLLANVAVRLSLYVNQSENIKCVCKSHKVVQSVTHNRLKNKSVHTLLYLYVNLRLLNKCEKELNDFLEDAHNEEICKGNN